MRHVEDLQQLEKKQELTRQNHSLATNAPKVAVPLGNLYHQE
jgi:hypothetical protein